MLNSKDTGHEVAKTKIAKIDWRIVTTPWVLTEVADAMAALQDRQKLVSLLRTLVSDPNVEIVSATDDLFERGVELFRQRPDKDWPLTDCISFVIMENLGINEALTADVHFRQAGFRALMLEG